MAKPKFSKSKKTYRKKTYRKHSGKVSRANQTLRGNKEYVQLQFADSLQLYNETGNVESVYYRLNSIRQPQAVIPGAGVWQPVDACIGWSQWASFYQRYRVYKVSYSVDFVNADPNQPYTVFVQGVNNVAPAYPSADAVMMQPHTYVKQIGTRDGNSICRMSGSYSLPKLVGMSSLQYKTSEKTQSTFIRSPEEIINLSVGAFPSIIGTQSVNVSARIKLTYHCELYDPLNTVNYVLPTAIHDIHIRGDRLIPQSDNTYADPDLPE